MEKRSLRRPETSEGYQRNCRLNPVFSMGCCCCELFSIQIHNLIHSQKSRILLEGSFIDVVLIAPVSQECVLEMPGTSENLTQVGKTLFPSVKVNGGGSDSGNEVSNPIARDVNVRRNPLEMDLAKEDALISPKIATPVLSPLMSVREMLNGTTAVRYYPDVVRDQELRGPL
ncbi:hypothetical protein TNCV_3034891 [Trichonephila clavipes]|nr:hypothetical protein TNCV_3034891 [Trichonephila clavipes]